MDKQFSVEEIEALRTRLLNVQTHGIESLARDVCETIDRLLARNRELTAEIDAAWLAIHRGWDVEPREYFETEAPKNGFGSPLAMAVHYMWKRETSADLDAAVKAETERCCAAICFMCANPQSHGSAALNSAGWWAHQIHSRCLAAAIREATNEPDGKNSQ